MLENMLVLPQGTILESMYGDTLYRGNTYLTGSREGRASCPGREARTVQESGSRWRSGAGGREPAGTRGSRRRGRTPARAVPCCRRECRLWSLKTERRWRHWRVSCENECETACAVCQIYSKHTPSPSNPPTTSCEFTGAFLEYGVVARHWTIDNTILNTLGYSLCKSTEMSYRCRRSFYY